MSPILLSITTPFPSFVQRMISGSGTYLQQVEEFLQEVPRLFFPFASFPVFHIIFIMKVYAKGLNFMGQLAQGHFDEVHHFTEVAVLGGRRVRQLGAHMTQSFALLEDNQLLHWGWVLDSLTTNRVLSFYKRSPTLASLWQQYSIFGDTLAMRSGLHSPLLLNRNILDFPISKFSVGGCYLLILLKDGTAHGMGENYRGQLGTGDTKYRHYFERLALPIKEKVIDISCGYQHSLVLTESGRVYGSGRANHFQLIDSRQKEKTYVDSFEHFRLMEIPQERIVRICAGHNHSLFLTEKQKLYSLGSNLYGQCGVANLTDTQVSKFTEVYLELEPDESIVQLVCGQTHNLLLTSQNRLLFFGNIKHNQMGVSSEFGFEQSGPVELKLPLQEGETITRIQAGFDRSAVITSAGDCIVWGGVDYESYGIPSYQNFHRLKLEIGQNTRILDVGLGYTHLLVTTQEL